MIAGWYKQFGAAKDVLEVGEMELPSVGPAEVRVRVHASGVNPSDVKKRAGYGDPFTEERIIPHSDGAGVIDQTGSEVDPNRVGERVWLYNGQYERPLGTAAEYIVLPAVQAVPLPGPLGFAEGACLGIPAMTAHRCLFAQGPIAGKKVLITGGAGAVGNYAIQFAKAAGANIITTISSQEKETYARQAGADHVIDYKKEDVVGTIMELTEGTGVDRIVDVDFGGNLPVTQAVLKNNGMVSVYASAGDRTPRFPVYTFMYKNINLQLVLVYNMPEDAKQRACSDINQAVESGSLTHKIAGRFPLDQLAAAHEAVESGTKIGNIIVEISGDP